MIDERIREELYNTLVYITEDTITSEGIEKIIDTMLLPAIKRILREEGYVKEIDIVSDMQGKGSCQNESQP